jgi:hypothetical protein
MTRKLVSTSTLNQFLRNGLVYFEIGTRVEFFSRGDGLPNGMLVVMILSPPVVVNRHLHIFISFKMAALRDCAQLR